MPEQHYTVTAKTDLVVTADAATLGSHTCLDYLPGSLFWGHAITQHMQASKSFDPSLFLSGRLRFLDGLPFLDGQRSFPLPLCFHKAKGQPWEGADPIIPGSTDCSADNVQPQQWRKGYMTANGAVHIPVLTYRIKTAIDRETRRSSDGQLFGYQSIPSGSVFCMIIQADSPKDMALADGWFHKKTVRLGRSRSAEYGLVEVHRLEHKPSVQVGTSQDDTLFIYLASDLVLLHDGMPSVTPRASDFSLKDAVFLPSRSFLRLRRYSPWNRFFNCRMSERQVVCKGSVIAFSVPQSVDMHALQQSLSAGIGLFREEGFGQILVNPSWLSKPPCLSRHKPTSVATPVKPNTPLIRYLEEKVKEANLAEDAYKAGLKWASEWASLSNRIANNDQKVPGKTQWANIREIAIRFKSSPNELAKELEGHCTEDLRRKLWQEAKAGNRSLWNAIKEKVGAHPGLREALALYHAAVEMSRRISKGRSSQDHTGSKEQ